MLEDLQVSFADASALGTSSGPRKYGLGVKLRFRTTLTPLSCSLLVHVAVEHDISDHTQQVLLAIPMFPLELAAPELNRLCAEEKPHKEFSSSIFKGHRRSKGARQNHKWKFAKAKRNQANRESRLAWFQ